LQVRRVLVEAKGLHLDHASAGPHQPAVGLHRMLCLQRWQLQLLDVLWIG